MRCGGRPFGTDRALLMRSAHPGPAGPAHVARGNSHHVNQRRPDGRKVLKTCASRVPGRVVRIDLGDGRCVYGRQLTGVTVEFYDRIGVPGEPVHLIETVARAGAPFPAEGLPLPQQSCVPTQRPCARSRCTLVSSCSHG